MKISLNQTPEFVFVGSAKKAYFLWAGEIIGVLRIDITDSEAGIRLVAITEEFQRGGHGTNMMRAAEQFSLAQLDTTKKLCLSLNVAKDAIGFYEKIGYVVDDPKNWVEKECPRMVRYLYSQK